MQARVGHGFMHACVRHARSHPLASHTHMQVWSPHTHTDARLDTKYYNLVVNFTIPVSTTLRSPITGHLMDISSIRTGW